MTNLQIKKEILKATKRVDNFSITIGLWSGDGCYHKEGTIIYNCIDIKNTDKNEPIEHEIELQLDNEELFAENKADLKKLKSEQNKIYNFLSKQFDNVTKYEGSV